MKRNRTDQEKIKRFNEERKQSIWKNFNTAEIDSEVGKATIIFPSNAI
ncbi:MAG: hypothetical protein KGQ36_02180 [Rickettsiales bacterium]|nr:hypothetical protein [Rickettsiales bacterium]